MAALNEYNVVGGLIGLDFINQQIIKQKSLTSSSSSSQYTLSTTYSSSLSLSSNLKSNQYTSPLHKQNNTDIRKISPLPQHFDQLQSNIQLQSNNHSNSHQNSSNQLNQSSHLSPSPISSPVRSPSYGLLDQNIFSVFALKRKKTQRKKNKMKIDEQIDNLDDNDMIAIVKMLQHKIRQKKPRKKQMKIKSNKIEQKQSEAQQIEQISQISPLNTYENEQTNMKQSQFNENIQNLENTSSSLSSSFSDSSQKDDNSFSLQKSHLFALNDQLRLPSPVQDQNLDHIIQNEVIIDRDELNAKQKAKNLTLSSIFIEDGANLPNDDQYQTPLQQQQNESKVNTQQVQTEPVILDQLTQQKQPISQQPPLLDKKHKRLILKQERKFLQQIHKKSQQLNENQTLQMQQFFSQPLFSPVHLTSGVIRTSSSPAPAQNPQRSSSAINLSQTASILDQIKIKNSNKKEDKKKETDIILKIKTKKS